MVKKTKRLVQNQGNVRESNTRLMITLPASRGNGGRCRDAVASSSVKSGDNGGCHVLVPDPVQTVLVCTSDNDTDSPLTDIMGELDSEGSISLAEKTSVEVTNDRAYTFISMNPPHSESTCFLDEPTDQLPMKPSSTLKRPLRHLDEAMIDQILTGKKRTRAPKKAKVTKHRPERAHTTSYHEESEDDNKELLRSFTTYVQVWSGKLGGGGKKSAKLTSSSTITRGPFKMDTSQTFDTFKNHIAKALSCRPSTLPVVKFEWKFENQAQNAPKKKIADHSGYEALLDAVKAKRANENIVVWLYTPKPPNDEEEWDDGGPDGIAKPFSVDRTMDNTSPEPVLSRKGQIESMAAQSSEARLMLLDKYPPGHVKMFPLKRVWHDTKNNRYFELTPIRLQVWAAAIANHRDGVDFETPPHSAHFADSGKLKVPTNSSPEVEGGTLASSSTSTCHASPVPQMTSQFPAVQHPAVATGYSMPYYPSVPPPYMPYMYPYGPQQPPSFFPPFLGLTAAHPLHQRDSHDMSAPSSPSRTTSHGISLQEFCAKLGISESDREKLTMLEYVPGNRLVEKLDEKEWRGMGGFTRLGWETFLTKHKKFCAAIKLGIWQ